MSVLKKYRCHEVVEAAKIGEIEPNQAGSQIALYDESGYKIGVRLKAWAVKHEPKVGDYYVKYEDGYISRSPAAAFEAGYSLVDASELPQLDEIALLSMLKNGKPPHIAASKTERFGEHYEVTVSIGNDHVARVTLDDEALKNLCRRGGVDFDQLISSSR